jgi:hypothetical protein
VRWSVTLQAVGDRELGHDEIVALADAVAGLDGIASGIGQPAYGAQLVVDADDRESAVDEGLRLFTEAAATAGLPAWPVDAVDAVNELDDQEPW